MLNFLKTLVRGTISRTIKVEMYIWYLEYLDKNT